MARLLSITARGPVFDGRAQTAFYNFAEEAEAEIADEGKDLLVKYLRSFVRHPTGYYESHLRVEQQGNRHMVTDGGRIVYGPWLAGVGSRNNETRFKGYKHWRLATQELDRRAEEIAERVLPPFLRRMN